MICENYIDRENEATSKFLANMQSLSDVEPEITSGINHEVITTPMVNVPFDINYSSINDRNIKEKGIFNSFNTDMKSQDFVEKIKHCLKDSCDNFITSASMQSDGINKLTNGNNLANDVLIGENIDCHIETFIVDDFNVAYLTEDVPTNDTNAIHSDNKPLINNYVDSLNSAEVPCEEDKPYKCQTCGMSFSRNSSLKCHFKLHAESSPNVLNKDNAANLNTTRDIKQSSTTPLNNESCENPVEVSISDPPTSELDESHSQVKEYKCIICGKSFSRKSSLTSHYKYHPNKKLITSPTKPTSENGEVVEQKVETINNVEINEAKPYKCDICGKPFSRQTSLAMHLTLHAMTDRRKSFANDDNATSNQVDASKIEEKGVHLNNGDIQKSTSNKNNSRKTAATKNSANDINDVGNITESFACNICSKEFNTSKSLKLHANFHRLPQENQSVLEDLNAVVVSDDKHSCCTKKHNHKDESVTLYMCEICQMCFCTIGNLRRHFTKSNHKNDLIDDEEESEIESSDDESSVMVASKTKGNVGNAKKVAQKPQLSTADAVIGLYRCGFCSRFFNDIDILQKHVINHTLFFGLDFEHLSKQPVIGDENEDDGLYCVVCGRSFSNFSGLQKHMSCHDDLVDHSSDYEITLMSENEIYLSEGANPDNDSYLDSLKCSCCNKLFTSIRALRLHVSNHSRNVDESELVEDDSYNLTDLLKCDRCDKFFASIRALKLHITSHTKNPEVLDRKKYEDTFRCGCCCIELPSISDLRLHLTTYHTRLDGKGEFTTYVPQTDDELVLPLECDVCDKFFPDASTLNTHKSGHSPLSIVDDSFISSHEFDSLVCDCCDKKFSNFRLLKVHVSQNLKENALKKKNFKDKITSKEEEESTAVDGETVVKDEGMKCEICDRYFPSEKSLKLHSSYHTKSNAEATQSGKTQYTIDKEGNYKCSYCGRVFGSLKAVSRHFPHHKVFPCKQCHCTFNCQKFLAAHVSSVHVSSGQVSSAQLPSSLVSSTHNKSYSFSEIDDTYKCKFCDKTFTSLKATAGHMSIHKKKNDLLKLSCSIENNVDEIAGQNFQYKCDICESTFDNLKSLAKHAGVHEKDEKSNETLVKNFKEPERDLKVLIHKCDICDKAFGNAKGLTSHSASHRLFISPEPISNNDNNDTESNQVDEKVTKEANSTPKGLKTSFKCETCGKEFDSFRGMRAHLTNALHQNNDNHFSAQNKAKEYPQLNQEVVVEMEAILDVETESTTNTSEDEFACESCNRKFDNAKALKRHLMFHKFNDSVDESAEIKQNKKASKRLNGTIIDGEKDLKAKKPRSSAEQDELISKCTVCEKKFTQFRFLKRHMALAHKCISLDVLDGEMPFECVYCEKCFGDKTELLEHVKMHADNEPTDVLTETEIKSEKVKSRSKYYKCKHCEKGYENRYSYISHCRVHRNKSSKIDIPEQSQKLPVVEKRSRADKKKYSMENNEGKIDRNHNNNDSSNFNKGKEQGSKVERICERFVAEYTCELCSEKFDRKNSLRRHYSKHPDVVIECNYCSKKFLRKIRLKNHINKHTGGSMYHCWFCGKRFKDKVILKSHVQGHKKDDLKQISCLRRKRSV